MSKFMSSEEFSEWAERHTPAEVEQMAIELQDQLVSELRESAGVSREEYEHAGRDEKQMIVESGGQVWLDEAKQTEAAEIAADSAEQDAVLREFCSRHPNHFPSESNGNLFKDEYVAAFQEANPGVPIFWELNAMEVLYSALSESGAFEVERVYKSE
jgi:hypothetical protein